MTFAWIARKRPLWPASMQCRVLEVTRGGYYAWSRRQAAGKLSPRLERHRQLTQQVRLSYVRSRGTYGAPRITAQLKGQGIAVCVNTVAKILRECGLRVKRRRRFIPHTTRSAHGHPVAPNLLERSFKVSRPDAAWVADISYIATREGWLYLATLMDLFSRKIVGWQMADHLKSELACDALRMAIQRRTPPSGLICHSDRGVQYACRQYRSLLERHGLICSMSRRGDCYDNAPAESFFATLKGELTGADDYATRQEAQTAIFEFIEVFYNRKRLHSALGYKSPEQFEAAYRVFQNPAPTENG
jgi:putative transposase